MWPAVEHPVPGGQGRYYLPAEKVVSSDLLVPLLDHTKWECMPFAWKSPLGQVAAYPDTQLEGWGDWSIKAFPLEAPAPLLQAACAWDMPRTFLVKLAKHFELRFQDPGDEVELMMVLIKGLMKVEGEDALKYVEMRAAKLADADNSGEHDAEVLGTGDSQDCLNKFDKTQYTKLMKDKEKAKTSAKSFAEGLKAKRATIRAPAAASSSGAPGSRGRSSKKRPEPPRLVIPGGALTQPEAKLLAPPDSNTWHNQSAQTWCGKVKGMGEVSRSWLAHGRRAAAVLVLRVLWERTIMLGKADACPIPSLYDDASLREG